MNKFYLITLSGGGDTEKKLVNQEVWDWIFSSYESKKSSYYEALPVEILNEIKKHKFFNDGEKEIMVTRGSYENDRALHAPGVSFESTKQVMNYLKENNLEISEEYDGYIY